MGGVAYVLIAACQVVGGDLEPAIRRIDDVVDRPRRGMRRPGRVCRDHGKTAMAAGGGRGCAGDHAGRAQAEPCHQRAAAGQLPGHATRPARRGQRP